jgi:hypothetical protein
MQNAPTTNSNESAPDKRDYTPGALPTRVDTVTAEVLAKMLESHRLTGMESVFNQNTTRLAAFVGYLQERYGWNIERKDMAVDTKDGRTPWITTYWLAQDSIAAAFEAGARQWVDNVKAARADRRKQANKSKMSAAEKNSLRSQLHRQDPRQGGLWGDL